MSFQENKFCNFKIHLFTILNTKQTNDGIFSSKAGENFKFKSSKTKILADGLIKRTSSILDEIESKNVHKDEEGDW